MGHNMECQYCEILKHTSSNFTFAKEMDSGVVLLNHNQSFSGRCLFIYKRHFEDVTALSYGDFAAFNTDLLTVAKAIKSVFSPTLVNIGMFGNKIRHLHWHLIPRYEGDSNWGGVPWPNEPLELARAEYRLLAKKIADAISETLDARHN